MKPYNIVLADDHNILRAGLKNLIEKESGFKVVAQASDGEQLLTLLKKIKCDLIVLDLSMPNLDGIASLKEIRSKYPKLKVLILTMQKDQEHFKHAMAKGAAGYVLKDDAYEQLILAIKTILKGKKYISPSISLLMTENMVRSLDTAEVSSLDILTRREQQVLKYVATGMANKNIAVKLKLSVRTVETHRSNLSHKLGLRNTAALVKFAYSKGMI